MTNEEAQRIVNAVWRELASRKGLDIEQNIDNSNRELMQDIYDSLQESVQGAAGGYDCGHPFLPWEEDE